MKVAALGIGHFHSPIYVGGNGVEKCGHELVGLHEDDPEIATARGQRLGRTVETDPVKALDGTGAEFAIVMGPPRRMPELLRLVIDRNLPFLIEKPTARNTAEIIPLIEEAKSRGLFTSVAFCLRWHPGLRLIREWLENGRLGSAGWLRLEYFGGAVSRYPAMMSPWMYHRAQTGGGCVLNLGIHALDALQFFNMQPVFADGILAAPWQQADYEDFSAMRLRCGKAVASIECGYAMASPKRGFAVEVMAANGNAQLRKGVVTWTGADGKTEEQTFADGDYRFEMLQDLLDLCAQGKPSPIPLECVLPSLRLIDALYASTASQSPNSSHL